MSEPTRWISVGELAHAFTPDSNAAGPTSDLMGRTLTLSLEDGTSLRYRFEAEDGLYWSAAVGPGWSPEQQEHYFAVRVRPGVYFVDHVHSQVGTTCICLVIDLGLMIVTVLTGRLPDAVEAAMSLTDRAAQGKELTAVEATFASGAVDGPFTEDTPRRLPTGEMVGKRVEYTYSPTERYEHIYLNEHLYTWHCLLGAERGLADTDRCHYYKLADDLYLFVWREKIVPTLGVVVVDFTAMRTVGKIFGYQGGEPGKTANFTVGANARLLNVTERH